MFANKQLLAGRSVLLQWAAEALQSSKEVVAPEDHQPWFGMFPNHINNESAKLCSTSLFQYIYIYYIYLFIQLRIIISLAYKTLAQQHWSLDQVKPHP